MRPGLLVFETPLIGMVCFAIILANWFGGVRYFQDVPGGLIAIAAGTLIAWGSNLFGLGYGGLSVGSVGGKTVALVVESRSSLPGNPGMKRTGFTSGARP